MDAVQQRIEGSMLIEKTAEGIIWLTALPILRGQPDAASQLLEGLDTICMHPDWLIGLDLTHMHFPGGEDRALLLARGHHLNPYALAVVVRSRAAQLAGMVGTACYSGRLPLRIFCQRARASAWLTAIRAGQRRLA